MSTRQYVSFTTDLCKTPWLGKLPLTVEEGPKVYDVSKYVPANATEILIYLFVTVRDSHRPKARRSVYEIFTEDTAERRYSQLMNVVFTKDDDFVMNSANMWLPLHKQEFTIRLPAEWTLHDPSAPKSSGKRYRNLAEAMKDFTSGDESVFADVFLLGYRN